EEEGREGVSDLNNFLLLSFLPYRKPILSNDFFAVRDVICLLCIDRILYRNSEIYKIFDKQKLYLLCYRILL
ncbi:MAG: hypothetical protein ACRD8K_05385, partial [Nitrososphaeraceae archaeon]